MPDCCGGCRVPEEEIWAALSWMGVWPVKTLHLWGAQGAADPSMGAGGVPGVSAGA